MQTMEQSPTHPYFEGIDAIFFDLDNTLIGTRAADKNTCEEVSLIQSFPNFLLHQIRI